jgi:hypothetical protein
MAASVDFGGGPKLSIVQVPRVAPFLSRRTRRRMWTPRSQHSIRLALVAFCGGLQTWHNVAQKWHIFSEFPVQLTRGSRPGGPGWPARPRARNEWNGCNGRSSVAATKWQQMAVGGSFWEEPPAVWPRAARSTKNSLDGKRIGGSAHGIWSGCGSFALSRWPRRRDPRRSIVGAQFPLCLYLQCTSFCRFRECTYALMRANTGRGVNAERT